MKKLNDYGVGSGGYIFDELDRGAHNWIRGLYPQVPYWLTASAQVSFLRPLEDGTPFYVRLEEITAVNPGKISVIALMMEPGRSKPIAKAKFLFVGKDYLAKK